MMEMNEETIIEKLLDKAHRCYKKAFSQHCPTIGRMLDRKQPVEINGIEYTCWRELVVATCGNIINDYCPDAEVEVELDGNNSTILVKTMSDEDEKVLQEQIKNMVA